jgi:hypothetical protein
VDGARAGRPQLARAAIRELGRDADGSDLARAIRRGWLKKPGEAGYTDADARLLNDGGPQGAVKMSFHFRSARDFPDRSGVREHCESIRTGC